MAGSGTPEVVACAALQGPLQLGRHRRARTPQRAHKLKVKRRSQVLSGTFQDREEKKKNEEMKANR
eukprot:1159279-Pelagomonas_calceolata.AAC.26